MNISILNQKTPTMSSREIANLCEKEHRNVCRDIDNLNETYEKMGLLKVEQGYYTTPNTGNQHYREFLLTKEQTIDLITGYRADVRIRINRRWQELENYQPKQLTRLEILQIAMQAEQENIALREQVATLAPKAQALDLLEVSQGSLGVRATAKTLNIPQNKFVAWCIKHDWLYRDNKDSLCMVSNRMKQGFMEQRPVSIATPNGEIKSVIQPMFTPKGLSHLAKIFAIVSEVA